MLHRTLATPYDMGANENERREAKIFGRQKRRRRRVPGVTAAEATAEEGKRDEGTEKSK